MTGLLTLAGCAHSQLSAGSVRDVEKLAIVVRVLHGPKVATGEQRDYPSLSPSEADRRLEEVIAKQVTTFELEERLREAILSRLPREPPWSTTLPAAVVATALQSFLVVDRSIPIDYEALRAAGADAVLELKVVEWGVAKRGKTALYMRGEGRLSRLPSRWGIWANTLDIDLADDGEVDEVDVVALRDGGFRDAVVTLVGRLADRVAPQLAGKR